MTRLQPKAQTAPAPPTVPRLFQVYQEDWQRGLLDPHTTPLEPSGPPSELPELSVPLALLNHTATASAPCWGVMSWRLGQQTGLTGLALHAAIEQHSHADIYHLNAGAADEGLFHNAWLEAETQHPGLVALATALLRSAQVPTDVLHSIHSAHHYSNPTVLVANRAFWSRYLPFLQHIVHQASTLDAPQRALLRSPVSDDSALLGSGSSLLGVIVRRLLPVFLATEGGGFKVHKLPLPNQARGLGVHQQRLREMKQVAHSGQSAWLADCWLSYRDLYLNQSRGTAWCEQHLPAITPSSLQFY